MPIVNINVLFHTIIAAGVLSDTHNFIRGAMFVCNNAYWWIIVVKYQVLRGLPYLGLCECSRVLIDAILPSYKNQGHRIGVISEMYPIIFTIAILVFIQGSRAMVIFQCKYIS